MTDQHGNCPICNSPLTERPRDLVDRFGDEYSCPQCGKYLLEKNYVGYTNWLDQDPERRLRLSHRLRWMPTGTKPLNLTWDLIQRLAETPLPEISQQADNVILWIGQHYKAGGYVLPIHTAYRAIAGVQTVEEVDFLLDHLIQTGRLQGEVRPGGRESRVRLSFEGWLYYAELARGARGSKRAFMAMQYGAPDLAKVVEEIFKPAVEESGFALVRLDQAPKAGLIDDNLRVEIRRSRFLIADLTHENRGAYWEAGFAEGLGKPVIYTCEKSRFQKEKPHFDTNHHVTVLWDASNLKKTADDLKATIRATLPDEARLEDPS